MEVTEIAKPAQKTIVIAENSFLVEEGLRSILTRHDDWSVIDTCSSEDELVKCLETYRPGLLISNVTHENGFDLDRVSKRFSGWGDLKVLAIDNEPNISKTRKMLLLGVAGYLFDSCGREEVLDAVEAVLDGKRFYCESAKDSDEDKELDEILADAITCCETENLSRRELDVVKEIAKGLTNKEIGENLFLSVHTIATHRKNIMRKLEVSNAVELVRKAKGLGYL